MKSLMLALLVLAASAQAAGVHGVVTDIATKQPIARASVMLLSSESIADARVVTTDDRGRFAFENVPSGTYRLRAEHEDYVRGDEGIMVDAGASRSTPVSLTLLPSVVISGRVTDEHGAPARRIYVRALTSAVAAETRTNDLGEYRLFGLRPGEYMISAERYAGPTIQGTFLQTPTPPCPDCPGEGTMRQPLAALTAAGGFIDPRALTGRSYPPVFYPGTTDRASATPLKAGPGARLEGIDLQLIAR